MRAPQAAAATPGRPSVRFEQPIRSPLASTALATGTLYPVVVDAVQTMPFAHPVEGMHD